MKKLLMMALALATAGLVQASELWWTVDTPMVDGSKVEWDSAKLMVSSSYGYNTGTAIDTWTKDDLDVFGGMAATELGTYGTSANSFFIELYNGSQSVGKSYVKLGTSTEKGQGAVGYNELVAANAIVNPFGGSTQVYTGFSNFTTATVVPEPTSGLMILLGLAALGLKRKRA